MAKGDTPDGGQLAGSPGPLPRVPRGGRGVLARRQRPRALDPDGPLWRLHDVAGVTVLVGFLGA
eukprot:11216958-Lingulodinium_polyedra.AAC.1